MICKQCGHTAFEELNETSIRCVQCGSVFETEFIVRVQPLRRQKPKDLTPRFVRLGYVLLIGLGLIDVAAFCVFNLPVMLVVTLAFMFVCHSLKIILERGSKYES